MITRLFPRDTRHTEIVSGVSVMCMGLATLFDPSSIPYELLRVHNPHFWGILLFSLGLMQFIMSTVLDAVEHARAILAWLSGTALVWMTFEVFGEMHHILGVPVLMLGAASLYAFVINSLAVMKRWK